MTSTLPVLLIVDDEKDVTETLEEFLKPHFESVWIAGNGVQALEKCSKLSPNIILCDYFMPEMSGEAFLQQLRLSGNVCPVVFLTGNANKEFVIKAIQLGAADVLEKPFNLKVVLDSLHRVLDIEKRRNELASMGSVSSADMTKRQKMLGLMQVANARKKSS